MRFCLLDMAVENLDYILCLRYIFRYIVSDDLTLVVLVEHLFLHHTLTDGGHLWTVLRIDDSGNDIAAERRTNLIELLLVVLGDEFAVLVLHFHVEIAYFKFGTVGGKTAEQCRRDTWSEVASYDGRSEKAYLRFLFLEEIYHESRVRICGIREQAFGIEDVHLVHTIFHYLVFHAVKAGTGDDALQLHAESVGELAAFCQQFESDILYCRSLYFAIYKYVVHGKCALLSDDFLIEKFYNKSVDVFFRTGERA